jgi:hypothetical protein
VQMGIIKHLAEFLGLLSMPCRISYLPLLDEILKKASPYNWRLRKSLASQLSSLVLLPPPSNVFSTLFPLAMALLQDPVAEVRLESFVGVAQLFLALRPGYTPQYSTGETEGDALPISEEEGQTYLNGVSRAINSLTHSDTYQHRQLWAELALTLLKLLPKDLFEVYFLENIFNLTSDSVLNVRIAVARLLSGWKFTSTVAPWEALSPASAGDNSPSSASPSAEDCPWKWLLERNDIKECVQRLSQDDHDVYLAMVNLKPLFPEVEFKSLSCRGMKAAPGGVMPVSGQENLHDKESDAGQGSDGRVSRASSLSSHDEVDISGYGLVRNHSSPHLATPVSIPNLGVLRVDEVEFDTEMEPDFFEMDSPRQQINSVKSEEDEEEEQLMALQRQKIAQAATATATVPEEPIPVVETEEAKEQSELTSEEQITVQIDSHEDLNREPNEMDDKQGEVADGDDESSNQPTAQPQPAEQDEVSSAKETETETVSQDQQPDSSDSISH